MRQAFSAFRSLRNPVFAQLYSAQAVSLFGDALTWVGLALLAFELAPEDAAAILGTALTLRVLAFVMLSPLAGALADRMNRKLLLVVADLARVVIVGAIPFVTEVWQVYVLIFALNAFTAFFTPTFQATIPLVTKADEYPQAIALSGATYEILGVLGPGVAGGFAALLGDRSIFWLDAGTFLLSAILIMSLPVSLRVATGANQKVSGLEGGGPDTTTWNAVKSGTARLWRDASLRYALVLELAASIAGAVVLVNTVVLVQDGLALGEVQFGAVMAAFGLGATVAALAVGALDKRMPRTSFVFMGALVTSLAILPANFLPLYPLMALWLLAGAGQNWVNLPTQTLIADRTPTQMQGRVYGAHFAWSHLWWAFAYPIAGWLGSAFPDRSFLYGGLLALGILLLASLFFAPRENDGRSNSAQM